MNIYYFTHCLTFVFISLIVCIYANQTNRISECCTQNPPETSEEVEVCKARCDAQWKSDFYMHFQKDYDEEFYEFPLDATITSSIDNLHAFCNITKHKIECWHSQCRLTIDDIPWSSDLHICTLEKQRFEKTLPCLNSTSHGAHNECNELCRRLARGFRTREWEKKYLYDLSANLAEIYQYRQLNRQCAFQICQLECRQELIRRICDSNAIDEAQDVLHKYYQNDLIDQVRSLADSSTEHLFPLTCRQYLPVDYQIRIDSEMERELKHVKVYIRRAINSTITTSNNNT